MEESKLVTFSVPYGRLPILFPYHSHIFRDSFSRCLENLVYHFFRQLWLVLGVKLMETGFPGGGFKHFFNFFLDPWFTSIFFRWVVKNHQLVTFSVRNVVVFVCVCV